MEITTLHTKKCEIEKFVELHIVIRLTKLGTKLPAEAYNAQIHKPVPSRRILVVVEERYNLIRRRSLLTGLSSRSQTLFRLEWLWLRRFLFIFICARH